MVGNDYYYVEQAKISETSLHAIGYLYVVYMSLKVNNSQTLYKNRKILCRTVNSSKVDENSSIW